MGGAIGGADMAAWGLARKDEIDPTMTALGVAGGAVGAAGITYLGGKMSRMFQAGDDKGAQNVLDEFQNQVQYYLDAGQGYTPADAYARAMQVMDLNEDALAGLIVKTGNALEVGEAAEDAVVSGLRAKTREMMDKAGVTKTVTSSLDTVDDFLGNVSTRLKNISEPIFALQRKMDAEEHIEVHKAFEEVAPFAKYVKKKLKKSEKRRLKMALANEDQATMANIFKAHPQLETAFKAASTKLEDIAAKLKASGYEMDKLDLYFPRVIKDPEALMRKIPANIRHGLEKEMGKKSLTSPEDQAKYINQYLRGRLSDQGLDKKLGATKERTIKNVTDDILDFYADPEEAIHTYLRDAIQDIARRKFFGRDVAASKANGELDLALTMDNWKNSAGGVLAQEINAGRLDPRKLNLLNDLIMARHDLTSRSVIGGIQDLRNIMYASTIANPVSAITQVGDIGAAAFANGIVHTTGAVLSHFKIGKKYIDMVDLGLEDIAEEFADTRATSKFLHKAFKYSGFRGVDRLGKNAVINGAYRKYTSRRGAFSVNTPKGLKAFKEKYGSMFGDELPEVIQTLKRGEMSENVKMMLFNELADLQPISLTEMPLKYLQAPNGRIFYMLKTFTLKQLDIMRRNTFQEFKKGNYTKGTWNLTKYVGLMTLFNTSAEQLKHTLITGEPMGVDDMSDVAVSSMIKNFGASEYLLNKYGKNGEIMAMLGAMVAPPLNVVDGLTGMFLDTGNMEEHIKHTPVFGKMWYYWMGDGVEKMMERKERNENKEFFGTADDDFWDE